MRLEEQKRLQKEDVFGQTGRYNEGMSWLKIISDRFEALIQKRYFQLAFWSVAAGTILTVLIFSLAGTLEALELSMLDVRLKLRSAEVAPSRDIVMVAIDMKTNDYIRQHPELGLIDPVLPREMMAQVLEYLNREGVRAVVFDLEFKRTEEQDASLAAAMRETPYVYSAARMEHDFNRFVEQNSEHFLNLPPGLKESYLTYYSLFAPYIETQLNFRIPFLGRGYLGGADLSMGPFYTVSNLPGLEQILQTRSMLTSVNRAQPAFPQGMVWQAPIRPRVIDDILLDVFLENCTYDSYEEIYRSNPLFLDNLSRMRLPVVVKGRLSGPTIQKLTRCYTFPVSTNLLPALTGLGAPTVVYDLDGFVRSVPVIARGYRNNYYTYLGLRPAIDLLGVDHPVYSENALTLDEKTLPLLDNQFLMVNWRNPRLLAESMLVDAGMKPPSSRGGGWQLFQKLFNRFSNRSGDSLDVILEGVSPEKNNNILNGGNIYRSFHIIDILRLARGETLSEQERAAFYNVPSYPQSGPFSFRDKIVVIGDTIKDIHRTPVSNTLHGPEIVATVLDMMLNDDKFVQKAPVLWQVGLILLLVVSVGAAVIRFQNFAIGFTVGLVLMALYWVFNFFIFVSQAYWFDLVVPSGVLGFALVASTLYRYYIHDQEKHQLTDVFSRYVSPQILGEIVKNPARAMENLKGEKKELTVLFADLQGFTQQFENSDPELMVQQLNEYFDAMTEILLRYGGTYDKYMGDAVMAFFGAPSEMPNHAEMACRAAVEMQKALHRLNREWEAAGSKVLSHGIGISSGEMFVGNFGSKNIKNFTVMGNNVNLGARLEAYTRVAQWPIIISARSRELAGEAVQVRDLGKIRVKGFTDTVQCYGLEGVRVTEQHIFAGWQEEGPEAAMGA